MPPRTWSAWRRRFRRSRKTQVAVTALVSLAVVILAVACITLVDQHVNSVNQAAYGNCYGAQDQASPAAYVVPDTAASHGHGQGGQGQGGQGQGGQGQGQGGQGGQGQGGQGQGGQGQGQGGQGQGGQGQGGGRGQGGQGQGGNTTPDTTASTAPCPSASGGVTPSSTSTATTTAANVNCDIIVPANPMSAEGLATPYQLTGPDDMSPEQSGCTMANAANLGAFVQATILNTQTGQLYVYDPLVITQGTTPAVAPVVPTLPAHYIATIDFGFNGTDLTQVGATPNALQQADCVNGQGGSVFGQVSFCNGTSFFNEAFLLEREGKLKVPSEGTSSKIVASGGSLGTGQDCPVTRNFDMVDQDPSDNVTTEYLLNPGTGQTAQDTTSNENNILGSTLLLNGSDNTLLDLFLDPTLGCTPFEAPDLANNGQPTSSQALDELLAAKNQPSIAGLVPENDEMTLDGNGQFDAAKTDLYREEVGQPPVDSATNQSSSPAMYCQNMVNIQTPFLQANENLLATGQSPVAATGDNLFTFMANRLSMSFTNLNCQNFGLTDPVTVTLDGNGVAVAATFNTTQQTASNTSSSTTPTQGQRHGRKHHQLMDPSGM